MKNNIKKIKFVLKKNREVIFAYLFGSRVEDKSSHRSDWDIAIYLNQYPSENNPWIRFYIQSELSLLLKTDNVDIVILNTLEEPSFTFEIISKGIILVDKEPSKRIIYEAKSLNRYFDWQYFLKRHIHKI